MKRLLLVIVTSFMVSLVHASLGNEAVLQPITINVQDKNKLQRGAKTFMNYCSGCHSLRFLRYNRMAKDLGLTTFSGDIDTELLFNNLVFTNSKIHDPIKISMPKTAAKNWFGVVPPDLSLSVRERGANWIYTYLKSFYSDPARPFGANNLLVPDVAMPNVLEPLIGKIVAVDKNNNVVTKDIAHLLLIEKGEMSESEFNSTLVDLVTFLAYVAEPAQLIRYKIGVGVIIFLLVFLVVAYQLKKAYWRKLH